MASSIFRSTFTGASRPSFCGLQIFNWFKFCITYQNDRNSLNRTYVENPALFRVKIKNCSYCLLCKYNFYYLQARVGSGDYKLVDSLIRFCHSTSVWFFSESSKSWHMFFYISISITFKSIMEVEEKHRYQRTYRHQFVSILHGVMVHGALLPRWPVFTS